MPQAPCKDCTDRYPGCHSKCEKYIEFDTKRKEYLSAKLKHSLLQNDDRYYRNVHRNATKKGR